MACGVLTLPILQEMLVLFDPVVDARTKLLGGPLVSSKSCSVGIELLARPMRTGDRSRRVFTPHETSRLLEQLIDMRSNSVLVHDGRSEI